MPRHSVDPTIVPVIETLHSLRDLPTDILCTIFGHLPQADLFLCNLVLPHVYRDAVSDALSRRTIRLSYAAHLDGDKQRDKLLRMLPVDDVTRLSVYLSNAPTKRTPQQRADVHAFLLQHYLTSERLTHLRLFGLEEFTARPLGSNLRSLHIRHSNIADEALIEYLKAAQPDRFRNLRISQCRSIRGEFLRHLASVNHQLHDLHLSVYANAYPEQVFAYLQSCPDVRVLSIDENRPRFDAAHPAVAGLVELRRLRLRNAGPYASMAGVAPLSLAGNLQHLNVQMTGDTLNEWLAAMPDGNRLLTVFVRLSNCKFRCEDAIGFQRLKELHTFCLVMETEEVPVVGGRNDAPRNRGGISNRRSTVHGLNTLLQLLAKLPALRRLELSSSFGSCLAEHNLHGALIAESLPLLQHLRCQLPSGDDGLECLVRLRELRTLHLFAGSRQRWKSATVSVVRFLASLCDGEQQHSRLQWLTVESVDGIDDCTGGGSERTLIRISELSRRDKQQLMVAKGLSAKKLGKWVRRVRVQEEVETDSEAEEEW